MAAENAELRADLRAYAPSEVVVVNAASVRMRNRTRDALFAVAAVFVAPVAVLVPVISIWEAETIAWKVVGVLVGVVPVAVLAFVVWYVGYRGRVAVATFVDANPAAPATELVAGAFARSSPHGVLSYGPFFAWTLAAYGRFGVTVAVVPDGGDKTIEAIDVPFEPVPLNENDPGFQELERLRSGRPSDLRERDGRGRRLNALPPSLGRLRRNVRLGGGWVVFVCGLVATVGFALGSIRTWQFGIATVVMLSSVCLTVFQGRRGGRTLDSHCLLVPAAIVVRHPALRRGVWRIHLFGRSRSVLFLYTERREYWHIVMVDEIAHDAFDATAREAELLLRAWLSPLPPPEPERLADLN